MYRKVFCHLVISIQTIVLFSQVAPPSNFPVRFKSSENYLTQINVTDANGRPFKNSYSEIKGSPFFPEEWTFAFVKINEESTLQWVSIRLNLFTQALHYKEGNNIEMAAQPGFVRGIEFYDSIRNKVYKFQTGFPEIDNQSSNNFYQVLSEGSVLLLKSIRKKLSENKNEMSGEIEKQFNLYEDYYVFANNKMERLKKEKAFILKKLSARKEEVEKFSNENHLNFKNIKDITGLFIFYNSIDL